MAHFLPDWLQELGAVAGLGITAFTFLDRFARGRPRLSIKVSEEGRWIRLSNDAPYDIAIQRWSVHPAVYGVAEKATFESANRAAAGPSFQLIMEPRSERLFPLTLQHRGEEPLDRVHKRALIVLHWR
jgi:hypothetical protein